MSDRPSGGLCFVHKVKPSISHEQVSGGLHASSTSKNLQFHTHKKPGGVLRAQSKILNFTRTQDREWRIMLRAQNRINFTRTETEVEDSSSCTKLNPQFRTGTYRVNFMLQHKSRILNLTRTKKNMSGGLCFVHK
jgi:hypothetical protein